MTHRPMPATVLFVRDVAKSAAFYRDLFSMRVLVDADDHVVLELDGMQLVVHRLRGKSEDAQASSVRRDSYIKTCFPVDSIADVRARAKALGGIIDAPAKEFAARGFRACDGYDSEGNVIQVRETDRG